MAEFKPGDPVSSLGYSGEFDEKQWTIDFYQMLMSDLKAQKRFLLANRDWYYSVEHGKEIFIDGLARINKQINDLLKLKITDGK